MLRLLKSGRWNRVPHMIRKEMSKHFLWAHFAERWIEIATLCIVSGHLAGCIFYIVAEIEAIPTSWTYVAGIQDAPPIEQYMTSLYWAFATMTTVGYGDINCTTYAERIWGVFVLLAGAILFSFLVGKMGVLSSEMDANNSECRQMMNKVDNFLRSTSLPPDLKKQVHEYYAWTLVNNISTNEKNIIANLSPSLREQVVLMQRKRLIKLVPMLKHSTNALQVEVVMRLEKDGSV